MNIGAVGTVIGLCIANFIWEEVNGDRNWERARERTYFEDMLNLMW